MLDETDGAGAPQALSWSWELDFAALMDSLNEPGPHDPTGPSAAPSGNAGEGARDVVPDELEDEGVPGELIPAGVLAGRVAEKLAPGPDLAAWLSLVPAAELGDADLAATAGAWRRMAAWAQAKELAAVAQIASRSAARDEDIGIGPDGRPARIPASAAAEVALELTMSRYGASWWAGLAVDLGWRLPGTGAALESGVIDLYRARLICEATTRLSDEAARSVESKVLPTAGGQTPGMLRAALRRAVIAADPAGVDRRREESERQAKVVLYPDEEHTAMLAGQRLPVIQATAAMARIRAMARAWKASGACGGMDLLSAKVYLGLLLGTLPLIPPAEDAPPDIPPGDGPGDPGHAPGDPGHAPGDPGQDPPGGSRGGLPGDGPPRGGRDGGPGQDDDDNCWQAHGPAPPWPGLPAMVPPALARSAEGGAGPVPGLLDVSLPWLVLAGASPGPGYLGLIGPVPAIQARRLAAYAAGDPAAEWRIIVTTSAGHAIAVTRIPRPRDQPGAGIGPGASGGRGLGLVGRVTLTIPEDILTRPPSCTGNQTRPGAGPGTGPPAEILRLALQAAGRAAARARDTAAADAAVGGCAHSSAIPGYRPPPRLRDHVAARDLTCRSPVCRQPAWRGELDHTIPWDEGLTCACNLGGVCKADHLLKHHPDWKLEQTAPGFFRWTTPSGRTFTVTPDAHPL